MSVGGAEVYFDNFIFTTEGLLIGETIRESVYTEKKRKLYSGLHILLKRKVSIFGDTLKLVINSAYLLFSSIVLENVQTYV